MAKKLAEMIGDEPYRHYVLVVERRFKKAYRIGDSISDVKDPIVKAILKAEYEAQYEKARAFAKPMEWQKDRALKLRDTYGMGVAAGFMRAHGWTFDRAHEVLFG